MCFESKRGTECWKKQVYVSTLTFINLTAMEKGFGPNENVKVERRDFTLNWGDLKLIGRACRSENN